MVASCKEVIASILRVKSNMDSGMFFPIQKAAVKALQSTPEWYAELNEIYRERKLVACELLDTLGCQYNPDQVGLFVWAKINDREVGEIELSDRILEETHVFITPGSIFGRYGKRYIRLSLCVDKETLEEAKTRIGNANLGRGSTLSNNSKPPSL